MSMKAITVDAAKINTFTINVKVLQVGNRQMTLSVFRQLQEEHIFDEESLTLRGRPWGTVNYHFDGCQESGEHLHVVWQMDARLLRCNFTRDVGYTDVGEAARMLRRSSGAIMWVAALEDFLASPDEAEVTSERVTTKRGYWFKSENSWRYEMVQTKANVSAERSANCRAEIDKALAEHRGEAVPEALELLKSLGVTAARTEIERRAQQMERAWSAAYDGIAQLDQLFIAL